MEWIPVPKPVIESDVTPSSIVDYSEIQSHLRLDGTDDQTLVENLISAVTNKIESSIGRKLITQVWSIYYDFFPRKDKADAWWDGQRDGVPSDLYTNIGHLELPFGPCQTVSFFRTYDESDSTSSFDASLYSVDLISGFPKIALKSGSVWPTTVLRPVNGIHIKATFGYGAKAAVPAQIKEACKIMVANLYQNRGDGSLDEAIPTTAQMLLEPFKKWRI